MDEKRPDEKRHTPRSRVLKSGVIEFGGGAITCAVRNLSPDGAGLDVESPVGIPDRFTLVIEPGHVRHTCHVIWRKQKRIGVKFQ